MVDFLLAALTLALLALAALWKRAREREAHYQPLVQATRHFLRTAGHLLGEPQQVPTTIDQLVWGLKELEPRFARQWQRALEERRRLSSVLRGLEEGIILLDAMGRVLLMNEPARALFGKLLPLHGARHHLELFQDARLDAALTAALTENQPTTCQYTTVQPRRVYEVRSLPLPPGLNPSASSFLKGGRVAGLLIVIKDITERLAVDQMRRDFVANVSHELRTPLTAVTGFAETLADPDLPSEVRERHLALMRQEADRMTRLVDDLLLLARLEAPGIRHAQEPVDLQDLARSVVAEVLPRAQAKGLHLELIADQAVTVLGQHDHLRQVLLNLLENALSYTQEGGITVLLAADADTARLSVRDTGAGIAAHHLPRVFERFYRVDPGRSRQSGGTGLGLAIVKHIVELHGGSVTLDSQVGRGTEVSVYLPLAPESTGPDRRPQEAAEAAGVETSRRN